MRDLQRLLAEDVLRALRGEPPRCPVPDPEPGSRDSSAARVARARRAEGPGGPLASPELVRWRTRVARQSSTRRRRSALAITETELKVIAALAIIGLSRRPKQRVEDARRERHAEHVVDEREEQVLPDVPHRRAAEPPGPRDAAQVALHERDARALHRDVGAGAHRDPDVGLRQRRRVVDPVARHRDDAALGLEPLDDSRLLLGQHLGLDLVDAERPARPPPPSCGCRP